MDKDIVTFDRYQEMIRRLFLVLWELDIHPQIIVGVWRGGSYPAIMLHELYMAQGVKPICLPVVAQSYQGYEQGDVNVLNLDVVTERVQASDVLLIVDDICDSGATLKSLREKLESKTGALVMTATLFHAEERNKTDEAPDFWIEKTDKWVVFPHEIQ